KPSARDVYVLYERAHSYIRSNDFDKALTAVNTGLDIEPTSAMLLTLRGYISSKRGESVANSDLNKACQLFDSAIADYDKALAANPKYALAYFRKGFAGYKCASYGAGDRKKYNTIALLAFDQFIAIAPADDPLVADAKKVM